MTPGGDAQRKEQDVTGEESKLESNHADAYGHNLPDGQRGGANAQRAQEPPGIAGDGPRDPLGADKRGAEPGTPGAIGKAEHQEGLVKPERPIVKYEAGPEALALRGVNHRMGNRPQNQAEGQQGQSEAQKAVAQKASVALALQRAGGEIASQ